MKYSALMLAGLCMSCSAVADEPISFRGARLGMTFEEVKALVFPDEVTEGRRKKIPTMQCTDYTTEEFDDDDVIAEAYRRFASLGVASCSWKNSGEGDVFLDVGNTSSRSVAYKIYRAPDGVRRLYQISIDITSGSADGLRDVLTTKFGEPVIDQAEVQNRMGATFPSFVAQWDRGGDTIKLDKHVGRLTNGKLEYFRAEYLADYMARWKAMNGEPKL